MDAAADDRFGAQARAEFMALDFDQVIAPMGRADFLRGPWDKEFVHISGTPGRFSHLLSWDELNAALEQHRLTPPRLKLYLGGQPVDARRFLTTPNLGVPRLDSGGLAACLGEGATLILDDVQEVAPRVRALMQAFQAALHTDAFANLYASWHSQNAFDLHWDPQSAMVLQLAGRKRWVVHKPTRLHPLDNDLEAAPRPTGQPVWDGMMEDGDVLYLPRGWWHVAYPVNEPSLHLTVSLTPPKSLEFLGWVVSRLRAEEAVRANLPALAGEAALAAHVKTLRRLIDGMLTEKTAGEFLREWEANIGPAPHIRVQQAAYEQFAPLADASRVRLGTLNRLFFSLRDGVFVFNAAGRSWTVPPDLVPALEMLSNARDVSLAELAARVPASAAANLRNSLGVLARAGVVIIEAGH